jgi:hypothetical protein
MKCISKNNTGRFHTEESKLKMSINGYRSSSVKVFDFKRAKKLIFFQLKGVLNI